MSTAADRLLARFEQGATVRTTAFNLGATAVVAAAVVRGPTGSLLASGGWVLLGASMLWLLAVGASPPPRHASPAGAVPHG